MRYVVSLALVAVLSFAFTAGSVKAIKTQQANTLAYIEGIK